MDDLFPGFDDPDDDSSGYFDDDGNLLNPDFVPMPTLCLLCENENNPHHLGMCSLHRLGQTEDDAEFSCEGFVPKGDQPFTEYP